MNREAILRILNRTRETGPVVVADPPKATPQLCSAPWDLLTHPSEPRERLTEYMDAWANMDESAWPEANVRALYEDIMDLFKAHHQAETWYQEWKQDHSEAR